MFVLPPPQRLPNGPHGAGVPGQAMLETNNILSHPKGLQYQLVVGEGTYVPQDCLHLATPPPHPFEVPVMNPNPLTTTPLPASAGTKLSLTRLCPKSTVFPRLQRSDTTDSVLSGMSPRMTESPRDSHSAASERSIPGTRCSDFGSVPPFGEGNPALAAPPNGKQNKDASKRRKPKSNILKSNSSFVSRAIPHDALQKRLQERLTDGLMAFANVNRSLQWLDLSAPDKAESLTKILFTKAHALCHDVNETTKTTSHIDIVMGFSSSDIIWYEPMSQKYARINKHGAINSSPVQEIRWLPNSDNLFIAAHADGTLVVYDKEKEDVHFVREKTGVHHHDGQTTAVHIQKSVQSRNQKANPVAVWKVSNSKINALAFSPDNRHLAVVLEDGSLRIIDYLREQLLDVFGSYYGGLMCVCWSPDGRYIATGGQDDLVSIWSLADGMLVARCQGHRSWVAAVAFDQWRCDNRNYRIGSVGEDCRLLLWDFGVGALHRPRASQSQSQSQASSSSHVVTPRSRADRSTTTRFRSDSDHMVGSAGDSERVVHAVEPRARTAMLPPVMAKCVDDHPLCWLGFEEDCILTSCANGHIRTWNRPKEGANESESARSIYGSMEAERR